MVGLDSQYGVWDIKEVKGRPRENEARELLQKIADQVKPICVAHKWNVKLLEEFIPPNPGLLGMNVNHQKIFIRLRPPSDVGAFYPYEHLLHTMLHELTHMVISPHNASFYKMLDELRDECEQLMRQGITGRNMPFAGDGKVLGGGCPPIDTRAAALQAAEKRQRYQTIMGGGKRLGGSSVGSGSAAERAAAAAEWRQAVSRGCAATQDGTSSQVDGGCTSHGGDPEREDADGWDCGLCTLHNSTTMDACDACGTPRSSSADVSTKMSAATQGKRSRSKRPGGGSCTAGSGKSVRGRSTELPTRSTWICRKCPFAFPNATERRTCESCGAHRSGDPSASGRQTQGVRSEVSPWACGACTVVNPGTFLSCATCQTLRAPEAGSTGASCGIQGEAVAAAAYADASTGRGGWNPTASAAAAPRFSGVDGSSSMDTKVCSMCTLRNSWKAFACVACGIPVAESAAATSAASTGATSVSSGGMREGNRPRRPNDGGRREGRGGGGDVASNSPPEIIDLT